MLVKVAPDLSDDDIDAAARVLGDMRVDGVIATNTTVSRIAVQEDPLARETGGLSGEPLMNKSRSEEHTSELQSLMRNSYAVFCLKKKKHKHGRKKTTNT